MVLPRAERPRNSAVHADSGLGTDLAAALGDAVMAVPDAAPRRNAGPRGGRSPLAEDLGGLFSGGLPGPVDGAGQRRRHRRDRPRLATGGLERLSNPGVG